MSKNKTIATEETVEDYFSRITDEKRREDCVALSRLISKATKLEPKMWGTSIVGFGSYHYKYESGREGDSCLTGFSSRSKEITLYLTAEVLEQKDLLVKLGKHKVSKGCLHLAKLSDVDSKILEKLVKATIVERTNRHGQCLAGT